ncbi:D-alanyl-D-alanine carboxypeptidase family protein [Candidatus Saccharibacteria bacterium]|nr:D-alanyl-D-alanine carboxypeptidase family protein [Candidatus Saccharibacteria bacterium]
MITKNKLPEKPKKITKKFTPIDMTVDYDNDKARKKKKTSKVKKVFLLILLMFLVAGSTFGIIWLFYSNGNKNASNDITPDIDEPSEPTEPTEPTEPEEPNEPMSDDEASIQPITNAPSSNPTISLGRLMLINPNFKVDGDFISARKKELISLQGTYGIEENKSSNGDNLLDREAAEWLHKMAAEYTIANPGHTLQTRSCFREVGTNCGRMCAATGTSDHHTGLTCDLIDPAYGTSLDTGEYNKHVEWQWLKQNSYKYGFIDRFPEAWAGGPMSEPANVDENGTTGLFETWHYRYVGVYAATQIATGVYNNGEYDSLEHYLKARGLVPNLLNN